VLAVAHLHHHFHGSKLGYIGLAAAVVVGWAGVPGVGESLLITAGIIASRGRLDLLEVLIVAWVAAVSGGIAGWLVGERAGHRLVRAPGPLRHQREKAVRRGARFFDRYGIAAVYFAPSWVAGTIGMSARRFLPANAIAAALWTLLVGLGAYIAGPTIADIVGDIGLAGLVVLGVLALAGAATAVLRRRR
jgi:membrane protein DedA with SNARE-associated domain